jgi:hypothetical protein
MQPRMSLRRGTASLRSVPSVRCACSVNPPPSLNMTSRRSADDSNLTPPGQSVEGSGERAGRCRRWSAATAGRGASGPARDAGCAARAVFNETFRFVASPSDQSIVLNLMDYDCVKVGAPEPSCTAGALVSGLVFGPASCGGPLALLRTAYCVRRVWARRLLFLPAVCSSCSRVLPGGSCATCRLLFGRVRSA